MIQKHRWLAFCLFTLSPLGARAAAEPPIERRADNLAALARLVSVVRFFHPSDEAAAADWNRFAMAGVAAVEGSPDPTSLARSLDELFWPIAPTVRVFPTGAAPPPLPGALFAKKDAPTQTVVWRHFGGKFEGTSKAFRSQRIDDETPPFGTLLQAIAPGDLAGRRVRLRARVRTALEPAAKLQLGLRVDRPRGSESPPGFFDNMADRPIVGSTPWRTVEIEGEVAGDAERIVVLAVLTGQGSVWLDDLSLAPTSGRSEVRLANAGFDEGEPGTEPAGWYFPYESIGAGYHLDLRRGAECERRGCVAIASDEVAAPRFARPDDALLLDLGAGVSARVPIALFADERGTLPHPSPGAPAPPGAALDPAPDGRAARIAALLLAWGNLGQFHPTLSLSPDEWAAALRGTLPEALAAAGQADREPFRRAVRKLLARLDDPVANDVTQRDDPRPAWLPIEWEWIEGRLVLTRVDAERSDVAERSVVTEIDGRPAAEVVASEGALISGTNADARRALALAALRMGAPGSSVRLRAQAPSGEVWNATLQRPERNTGGSDPPAVVPLEPGILYVDLRSMRDPDFERAIPRLAAASGIVFDLRGWSEVTMGLVAHLIGAPVDALTWEVPVYQLPDRRDARSLRTVNRVAPQAPRIHAKVAFLADARTFQNSERLLETIAAYRLGEIVGSPSAGNVGNPNWSDLPGGWTIAWTGRRALRRDGTPLRGIGIAPTIPAVRTLAGALAGRDEVIERAVAAIRR